eukprot:1150521-Pelagomonas_calceolata.AAC.3
MQHRPNEAVRLHVMLICGCIERNKDSGLRELGCGLDILSPRLCHFEKTKQEMKRWCLALEGLRNYDAIIQQGRAKKQCRKHPLVLLKVPQSSVTAYVIKLECSLRGAKV